MRDLLLKRASPDLDLAVEGSVEAIAEALADRLEAQVRRTTDFMTSTLVLDDGLELDLARARTETYPEPGCLPVVEAAMLLDDLDRRDFSVNAMAMALAPERFGELIDPLGGREDLERRRLRVLHDDSFEDDPTRMLRAVRFMLRLDFTLEAHTADLLARAVDQRRAADLSGARLRNELAVIFREAPARGLTALADLGLFAGMGFASATRGACEAARLLPRAARAIGIDLSETDTLPACLAVYAGLSGQDPAALAKRLMLDACARDAVMEGAGAVSEPPRVLCDPAGASEMVFALRGLCSAAALAVWTVLDDDGRGRLERYWRELRGTCADIDGSDLIEAGYQPGPGFTDALDAALAAKLDHGAGRDEQLSAATRVLDNSSE